MPKFTLKKTKSRLAFAEGSRGFFKFFQKNFCSPEDYRAKYFMTQ